MRTSKASLIGFIIIVPLITNQNIYAQPSYKDYSLSQMKIIFFDEFSDNRNNWYEGYWRDEVHYKFNNGYIYLESLSENIGKLETLKKNLIFINENLDFQIETRIRFVKGKGYSPVGLCWGRKDKNYAYYFYFDPVKYIGYSIFMKKDGKHYKLKNWTKSDLLKMHSYNKLTVRKVKDIYYFFFNESLVHTMPFRAFFGQKIGFPVPPNSVIHVDYLLVSYLPKVVRPATIPIE